MIPVSVRYADGSLFRGSWEEAPKTEVQTIAYIGPDGMAVVRHGGDYYRLVDGEVIPYDLVGLVALALGEGYQHTAHASMFQLLEWAMGQGFLIGSFIGPEKWKEIYQLGKADRDFLRDYGQWAAEVQ